ncbi:hypothetical protein FS837_010791 [Tulasnella sp. UAMH 9824]|nr:hypothetical protein FS837_010791 [Tulasnella sp. UAMH 9824]
MSKPKHATAKEDLEDATKGFDAVFGDDIVKAKEILNAKSSAFHQLGLGVVIFLQAVLGLECDVLGLTKTTFKDALMLDASKALTDSESSTNQALKASKSQKSLTRFPAGMEWEVLHADTVVLQGLTQALSESYMGYLKCLYSLNSAHGAFTKLFKRVFPNGLDNYSGPSVLPLSSEKPSSSSLTVNNPTPGNGGRGLLSRLTASAPASASSTPIGSGTVTPAGFEPEGALEDLIFYGVAFGGWWAFLVTSQIDVLACMHYLSLRPAKLTILTYEGLKLLLAGYQANEKDLIERLSRMLES